MNITFQYTTSNQQLAINGSLAINEIDYLKDILDHYVKIMRTGKPSPVIVPEGTNMEPGGMTPISRESFDPFQGH